MPKARRHCAEWLASVQDPDSHAPLGNVDFLCPKSSLEEDLKNQHLDTGGTSPRRQNVKLRSAESPNNNTFILLSHGQYQSF